jgi:hypothetical protein
MRYIMKRSLRRLIAFLGRYDQPYPEEIVLALILNTSQLALKKGEYVEFAPLKGVCGPFKLSGNGLPVFTYTVFEKKIMEFIRVTVEISKPDKILFRSNVVREVRHPALDHYVWATEREVLGEEVETKDRYKAPFNQLALYLFKYFPFPMEGGRKKCESPEVQDALAPGQESEKNS